MKTLEDLAAAHLLIDHPHGRWSMHPLLADYARHHPAAPPDRFQARDRLLTYYTVMTQDADAHLRALPGDPVPAVFVDRGRALARLDAERANLITAVETAHHNGLTSIAASLPRALATYLDWRRYFENWEAVYHIARRTNDRHGEARAAANLGLALAEVGRVEEAIAVHARACTLSAEVGDHHREARAWHGLGLALRDNKQERDAAAALGRAVALYAATDDHRRHAIAQGLGSIQNRHGYTRGGTGPLKPLA
ncbi:tetratricopeptide repeat protein [Allosalinactinospora lopnorensis]|uniref:tetratricopeptide repeat protein n=1 Tax=Allosalinactinospora lopnorensis TaxID=1352348 RepID=UPI0006980572|nr:tetratricopeptide repeat protein [Allosalinactinospora lopnorensis]